jgi:hypothetical protein
MIIRERRSGIDSRSKDEKPANLNALSSMPFLAQADLDDHTLGVTTQTAKEAFAKAVEWHVVERFSNVTISDGTKSYTIAEFSSVMALLEIANTVDADGTRGLRPERPRATPYPS